MSGVPDRCFRLEIQKSNKDKDNITILSFNTQRWEETMPGPREEFGVGSEDSESN